MTFSSTKSLRKLSSIGQDQTIRGNHCLSEYVYFGLFVGEYNHLNHTLHFVRLIPREDQNLPPTLWSHDTFGCRYRNTQSRIQNTLLCTPIIKVCTDGDQIKWHTFFFIKIKYRAIRKHIEPIEPTVSPEINDNKENDNPKTLSKSQSTSSSSKLTFMCNPNPKLILFKEKLDDLDEFIGVVD